VKGCDEAKQELQEVVEFLMNPDKFSALGNTASFTAMLVLRVRRLIGFVSSLFINPEYWCLFF
jgi:hypothetical protein